SLRVIVGNAADSDTGDPISQFILPVGFCVRYTQDDLAVRGVDENTLAPYYIDTATGERKTLGVQRTSFTPATATTPGQVCFATTHFSSFALSGNAQATATVLPTSTVRAALGTYSQRLYVFVKNSNTGW